jgi:hypothetical protein
MNPSKKQHCKLLIINDPFFANLYEPDAPNRSSFLNNEPPSQEVLANPNLDPPPKAQLRRARNRPQSCLIEHNRAIFSVPCTAVCQFHSFSRGFSHICVNLCQSEAHSSFGCGWPRCVLLRPIRLFWLRLAEVRPLLLLAAIQSAQLLPAFPPFPFLSSSLIKPIQTESNQ